MEMEEMILNYTSQQNELRKRISLQNNFSDDQIQLVAGVDIAYWGENNKEYGACCIQVIDFNSKKIVEQVEYINKITIPYISGFLAFRELPLVLEAVKKLRTDPDIYMFDGNGYLHKRNMGVATHASFYLEKPTIGVAKTYYKIENMDFIMPENRAGAFTDIVIDGEVYGRALRSRKDVKPIFVSCGNVIDLDTATNITMHFIEKDSRLPIPTRYADLATHQARKLQKDNV
ncbi:endonuclease V [Lysinibacillus sp. FJAT-14745]|uniref:endonuclease V n=1 Tax=Lysinibacillus sp. FJAT-14745 TaxID=1704289 RepID=UPI0006ABA9C7|nr:endonuclease V [Lysinibacillus sp. FJAT-14745]KOP78263.1 endonuclease V [Lysinibacillus sp. FJAT-14745]